MANIRRKLFAGLPVLMVMATLAAISMPAQAQSEQPIDLKIKENTAPEISIPDGKSRLFPETVAATVTVQYTVKIPTPASGTSVGVCPLTPITVQITKTNPEYATMVIVPESTTVNLGSGGDSSKDITVTATISVDRNAPAFKDGSYTIKAQALKPSTTASGCAYAASGQVPQSFTIKNDYIAIVEYLPGRYVQKTGQNKDFGFPIEITNFANGDTRITTEIDQRNAKNKLEAVTAPAAVTLISVLDSKTENKKTIQITGRTPHSNGYTNSLFQFDAKFTANPVLGGGEGIDDDQQTLSFTVQVQGVYVPGFDPATALLGIGLAVIALGVAQRRRRT